MHLYLLSGSLLALSGVSWFIVRHLLSVFIFLKSSPYMCVNSPIPALCVCLVCL